jgi:hypothetical protein
LCSVTIKAWIKHWLRAWNLSFGIFNFPICFGSLGTFILAPKTIHAWHVVGLLKLDCVFNFS